MKLTAITNSRTLVRFLVSMLLLRSLVAAGFMIAVSPSGLELTVCEGPVSFKSTNLDHSGHEHHHSSDHTDNNQLHISPTCSDWSTSSLLAISSDINVVEVKLNADHIDESIVSVVPHSYTSIHLIRAPPQLSPA